MIRAEKILLFLDASYIPEVLEDEVRSWELAEYVSSLASRIAEEHKRVTLSSLSLMPSAPNRKPSRSVATSETFRSLYKENIIASLKGEDRCDAIAMLPCLGHASDVPDWLKDEAERRYIPIAPFSSFFEKEEGDALYTETSRKRMQLARARRPMGRFGRGGREK